MCTKPLINEDVGDDRKFVSPGCDLVLFSVPSSLFGLVSLRMARGLNETATAGAGRLIRNEQSLFLSDPFKNGHPMVMIHFTLSFQTFQSKERRREV